MPVQKEKQTVEPMTDAEYRALTEPRCPFCRSREVEGGTEREMSVKETHLDMSCNECGEEWIEISRLTGYLRKH